MRRLNGICIIGLGLIGSSIARALRSKMPELFIAAVDKSNDYINSAINDKIIDVGFTSIEDIDGDSSSPVKECDVFFVCTPVSAVVQTVCTICRFAKPGAIITDTASIKTEVLTGVDAVLHEGEFIFVGGHPMAGTEKSGYHAGKPHLFENAYYVLTPSKTSTDAAIDILTQLVSKIGSIPVVLDATTHDFVTGVISHVPHVIASGLVNLVKELDLPESPMRRLAAGGFKDITRISSSNPEMWKSILHSNRHASKSILKHYINLLEKFYSWLDCDDLESIYEYFACANEYRSSLLDKGVSLIERLYEIIVDVEDRPGVIGEIATLLGIQDINIKNINVSNSREFELGCLRVVLGDEDSSKKAYELLVKNGYKVFTR